MIEKLLLLLNDLKNEYDADGVKVYFNDYNNYTIKLIKNNKIIKVFRCLTERKNKAWDIKK